MVAGSAKNLTVDSITDDNTGHLYLLPSMQLQVNSVMSPCARIFHGAELTLSDIKPSVSLERNVDIFGTLTISGSPSVLLGVQQGVVTMHPGSGPSNLKFGELIIASSGHLRLLNYDTHSPESCRWVLSISGSRFTLSDNSNMDVNCPLNLTGDNMNIGRNAALNIKGNSSVSYVSMNDVTITGSFDPGILSLLDGWRSLRIDRYGQVRFFPEGDVRLDTFYSNGNVEIGEAVYTRGRDPAVTSNLKFGELVIASSGRLRLLNYDTHSPESCRWVLSISGSRFTLSDNSNMDVNCPLNLTGDNMNIGRNAALNIKGNSSVSYVSMNDVTITGSFDPGILSLLDGWRSLRIERYGQLRFFPEGDVRLDTFYSNGYVEIGEAVYIRGRDPAVTSNLKFGELIIASSGRLRLLNYDTHSPESCRWVLSISGSRFTLSDNSNMDVNCPLNLTGDNMNIGRNAALNIKGNSSVSYVSMNDVTITGSFDPGILSLLDGWRSLRIERYGRLRFFPEGDVRLDTFYTNGNVQIEGAVYIRGRDPAVTKTIEIDRYGNVQFDLSLSPESSIFVHNHSQEYSSHGKHSLNGTSIVHADIVVVRGTWLPGKLRIEPGWKDLTVEPGGTFYFNPVGVYNLDKFYVDGNVKSLNAVEMAGLSQERIPQCDVGFSGVVLIDSADLTIIRCQSVVISGTLRVGNLFLGFRWDSLHVNGSNGKFYFETSEQLNINHTRVSGLMQTGSAVGPSVPMAGESVTIETSGTISINYQGYPSTIIDGAINSTFYVTNVQVDGLFRLGSLYLVTDNFRVGTRGRVTVNGGGALGGMGPGAGNPHSSGGSGASYGGRGGRGAYTRSLIQSYGDIFSPGGWGSGGGNGSGGTGGGRGGGRILLEVSQSLHVDGTIQMDGLSGQVVWCFILFYLFVYFTAFHFRIPYVFLIILS